MDRRPGGPAEGLNCRSGTGASAAISFGRDREEFGPDRGTKSDGGRSWRVIPFGRSRHGDPPLDAVGMHHPLEPRIQGHAEHAFEHERAKPLADRI